MSATANSTSALIGEGKLRVGILSFCALLVGLYVFRNSVPFVTEFLTAIQTRSEAVFSSAFTFLSVFWAAMLTIWSMLKSRATRYVERLTDNAVFQDFMSSLEIRLLLGLGAIVTSSAMYIVNPTLVEPGAALALTFWLFLSGAAVFLLFDSLLSARVVLA